MAIAKSFTLDKEELALALEVLLEKIGMAKGLTPEEKKQLAKDTAEKLTEAGIEVNRDNICDEKMIKKLVTALAATHAKGCAEKVGLKFDFDFTLLRDDSTMTEEEKEKLKEKLKKDLEGIKFDLRNEPGEKNEADQEKKLTPTPAPGRSKSKSEDFEDDVVDNNGVVIIKLGTHEQSARGSRAQGHIPLSTIAQEGDLGDLAPLLEEEIYGPAKHGFEECRFNNLSPTLKLPGAE